MKKIVINILKDFTQTPGARYRTDGPYSGQEFRETLLEQHFAGGETYPIVLELDGTAGYATSFLEEAFGGLARKYGKDRCLQRLEFVSSEDPLLVKEIQHYINNANGRKK